MNENFFHGGIYQPTHIFYLSNYSILESWCNGIFPSSTIYWSSNPHYQQTNWLFILWFFHRHFLFRFQDVLKEKFCAICVSFVPERSTMVIVCFNLSIYGRSVNPIKIIVYNPFLLLDKEKKLSKRESSCCPQLWSSILLLWIDSPFVYLICIYRLPIKIYGHHQQFFSHPKIVFF